MTDSKTGMLDTISKYRTQIMGFAAIWIFIFHVRDEILLFSGIPVLTQIEIYCDNIGFCGVDIFLFLSGWGIYHAINKHDLATFYKRRYRRLILPLLVVWGIKSIYANWGLIRSIKAITGWTFLTRYVHEPIWFIYAISLIYLLFPLYRKAFDRFSNKYIFTAAAILLWFALAFAGAVLTNRSDIYLFINRLPVFMIGVLFGWLTLNGKKDLHGSFRIVLIVMLVAGLVIQYFATFRRMDFLLPQSRNGLPALLIGIPMCFIAAQVFKLLDRVTVIQKIYGFFGKMTLEFYACQDISLKILKEQTYFSGININKYLYTLLIFLFSFGGGYLLHIITDAITKKLDGKPVFTKK